MTALLKSLGGECQIFDTLNDVILPIITFAGIWLMFNMKKEEEDGIHFKLLGYMMLGWLPFNIKDAYYLPLGFLIYLAFMWPKKNKRAKAIAALLGLFYLMATYITPLVEAYLFEKPKSVAASSDNIYAIDFQKDLEEVERALGIKPNMSYIADFDMTYKNDGTIDRYHYELISTAELGIGHIRVDYLPEKAIYEIKGKVIEEWREEWSRYMLSESFFRQLNEAPLEQMKPTGDYSSYVYRFDGLAIPVLDNTDPKFTIVNSELVPLNDRLDIIASYYIQSFGMRGSEESGTGGVPSTWYKLNGSRAY